MYHIYIIQNLINLKIYIGQTVNIKKRFARHKRAAALPSGHKEKQAISYAIAKYQIHNFSFQEIEKWPTQSEANEAEEFWIEFFHSRNSKFGYNRTRGGLKIEPYFKKGHTPWNKGTNGLMPEPWNKGKFNVYSKETLDKMSKSHIGLPAPYQKGHIPWSTGKSFKRRPDKIQYGEKHSQSILTKDQVLEIIELSKTRQYTQTQLAKLFNVSRGAINNIIHGYTWSFLTGILPLKKLK